MVTPFRQGRGFITRFDHQNNDSRELRRQKRDTINKMSQQPTAKRQATKDRNESQPTTNEDPQLTTKDRDGNSAVAITVGEVSKPNADLSTLTGRSMGSSSTLSSSKKEWAVHLGLVKFCFRKLADRVLEPYLKQTEPNIPPVITIPPGLSQKEFIDIAYTKHIAPLFNDWRHKTQSAMKTYTSVSKQVMDNS